MYAGGEPDLKRALRPVPTFERAVREVSRMFSEAGIRHALVGALGATRTATGHARPRTSTFLWAVKRSRRTAAVS